MAKGQIIPGVSNLPEQDGRRPTPPECGYSIDILMAEHTLPNGSDLRERYVEALIRECLPNIRGYEKYTGGDNNKLFINFTTHELYALIAATPIQRKRAALAAIDRVNKTTQMTPALCELRFFISIAPIPDET